MKKVTILREDEKLMCRIKKSNYLITISVFIDIIWYLTLTIFIISATYILFILLGRSVDLNKSMLVGIFLATIFTSIPVFVVISELRKVIRTVIDKKPFTDKNVKRFRIMGYSMLIFDLFLFIYIMIYTKITLSFGHINKGDYFFIIIFKLIPSPVSQVAYLISYFLVGCVLIIVSSIFKQAIMIKNENDLTV